MTFGNTNEIYGLQT